MIGSLNSDSGISGSPLYFGVQERDSITAP